jgi:hypothetical protein
MRIREILTELDFMGRRCTKDCSGHQAGYEWAKKNPNRTPQSASKSFNTGASIKPPKPKAPNPKAAVSAVKAYAGQAIPKVPTAPAGPV